MSQVKIKPDEETKNTLENKLLQHVDQANVYLEWFLFSCIKTSQY